MPDIKVVDRPGRLYPMVKNHLARPVYRDARHARQHRLGAIPGRYRISSCSCRIVSAETLKRLVDDASLSEGQRQDFVNTLKIDAELRLLREQATRLSRVASLVAPAGLGPVAASPAITIYDCHGIPTLPGSPVAKPAASVDATVGRVYAETVSAADFYAQVFGRNSIDDAGMTIASSVHYGSHYNNAFWDGFQMAYGDGDGSIFLDFSKASDVIGHELTHGVTQHSLQLGYAGEPGGLNESLSDCFGSMFRQWQAKQDVSRADWLIGKDIMGPAALARGYTCLRDMADPGGAHCLSPQPATYSAVKAGMDPHLSSGPINLAFSTIAKAVGGNSWDKVGRVWYKAVTGYGPSPNLRMKAFARRTRKAAADLYPGDTGLSAAIGAGWQAVGL